jgi:hypothetical protein
MRRLFEVVAASPKHTAQKSTHMKPKIKENEVR